MQHCKSNDDIIRRTLTCASLATLTTIGLFSLVAMLMSPSMDRTHRGIGDGIPMLEVTVVKAKRQAVASVEAQTPVARPKLELI